MPKSRPDHAEYLKKLGLSEENASDWEQLARNGGERSTDSYEVFPQPRQEEDGLVKTLFFVRGTSHIATEVESEWLLHLVPDEKLYAMRDSQNEEDSFAVALRAENKNEQKSALVGYLPQYLSKDVSAVMSAGGSVEITVKQVNPPPLAHRHRVQCELVMSGADYIPMSGEEFSLLV